MSREERRQYERMMRSMERGPALPPAARTRAERNAARRAARASSQPGGFTTRFFVVATLVALSVGFVAFSLQWPNMPFALYLGLGLVVATFALQVGLRLLVRRRARRTPD